MAQSRSFLDTPGTTPTILLIDGYHHDRSYYAQRLWDTSPGYNVMEAATGRMGLDLFQSQSIDCVVLELDLPDMSGFEVLLTLVPLARQPEIAVIFLTRLTNPHLHKVGVQNGAQAYLRKTFTSGDLLDNAILKAIATVPRDRKRRRGKPAMTPADVRLGKER
jgi:DNA-binding response OmpR family regulator